MLRGEFTKATKGFADVNDSYGRIKASVVNTSPAGDLSLIFNYMKMLDPASVVRESEFATAAATGTYGDRIQVLMQKISTGKKLSDNQRRDFVGRADLLFTEAVRIHKGRKAEFANKATQFGLDPSQVKWPVWYISLPTAGGKNMYRASLEVIALFRNSR